MIIHYGIYSIYNYHFVADIRSAIRNDLQRPVTVAAERSLRVGFSSTLLLQDTFRTVQLSAKFVAITARTSLVERPEHGRTPLSAAEQ